MGKVGESCASEIVHLGLRYQTCTQTEWGLSFQGCFAPFGGNRLGMKLRGAVD